MTQTQTPQKTHKQSGAIEQPPQTLEASPDDRSLAALAVEITTRNEYYQVGGKY